MRTIGFEELRKMGWTNDEGLKERLEGLLETDGILVFQNHMLDSSSVGHMTLVLAGPGRTFSMDDPPPWIGDLPSQRQQLVGSLDLDDVRKELGQGALDCSSMEEKEEP